MNKIIWKIYCPHARRVCIEGYDEDEIDPACGCWDSEKNKCVYPKWFINEKGLVVKDLMEVE
jgi:hypothetical protein